MKRKPARNPKEEPEILEIRRARAKLWKRAGGTVKGMMNMLRAAQAEEVAAGRALVVRRKPASRAAARRKRRAA